MATARLSLWDRRVLAILLTGFASGLPLALTGQSLQAWLSIAGIDLMTIGFFSLVGQPYAYKFLWAPLLDRFNPPLPSLLTNALGRHKSWLVFCQLILALLLYLMARLSPGQSPQTLAFLALLVAFFSASQDIVIDAYRIEITQPLERGFAAANSVLGYRLAMLTSGSLAFIIADTSLGWPGVYRLMAVILLICALISLTLPAPLSIYRTDPENATSFVGIVKPLSQASWQESLKGFFALLIGISIGFLFGKGISISIINWFSTDSTVTAGDAIYAGFGKLLTLSFEVICSLAGAYWAARLSKFQLLLAPLQSFWQRSGAGFILFFILFYKLGDAFSGALTTPFLLQSLHLSQTEVGITNKFFGLLTTVSGGLIGGILIPRWGLWGSLLIFGLLQALSNLGFWSLAQFGPDALGSISLWGSPLAQSNTTGASTPISLHLLLLLVVSIENFSGGMGTAAFVAYLMNLCSNQYTATSYALLSAIAALGRIYVGPLAGTLVESIGWAPFFLFSTATALPGILVLWRHRSRLEL